MASFFLETKTYAQSCFGRDLEAVLKTDVNSKVRVDRLLKENIKPPKIYMACGLSDSLLDANEDLPLERAGAGMNSGNVGI